MTEQWQQVADAQVTNMQPHLSACAYQMCKYAVESRSSAFDAANMAKPPAVLPAGAPSLVASLLASILGGASVGLIMLWAWFRHPRGRHPFCLWLTLIWQACKVMFCSISRVLLWGMRLHFQSTFVDHQADTSGCALTSLHLTHNADGRNQWVLLGVLCSDGSREAAARGHHRDAHDLHWHYPRRGGCKGEDEACERTTLLLPVAVLLKGKGTSHSRAECFMQLPRMLAHLHACTHPSARVHALQSIAIGARPLLDASRWG